ncbi:MAG: hypothetical protein FJY97_20085 [candidate division Zixibacteria bacterium]|nr:hypothetical protein [candidate division Zixibacteria bacterium]
MRRIDRTWVITLVFVAAFGADVVPARPTETPGAVHIDALEYGEDRLSIAQAVDLADRAGLKTAIITPHDRNTVEYGLPLLRNLFKIQVSRSSIQAYGFETFLEEIRTADQQFDSLAVIDGAETIPAYYWEKSPLTGVGVVRNFHKHLLVIGLSSPEDYEGIPSVTNGFSHGYRWTCLFEFWPAPLLGVGLVMAVRARRLHTTDDPRRMRGGVGAALVGGVLLVNNVSHCSHYDPYQGDPGDGPYQAVIDYANQRGGLTFWAHPEVSQRVSQPVSWPASLLADSIVFDTQPYTRSLLNTHDYTGFAIFEEGMYVVGKPGGVWDQTLTEYCAGLRKRPVWAIG